MTREEAIAILQEEIDGNLELTLSEWRERDEQKLFPAIRMAIKALQADAVSREVYDKRTQADEEIIDSYRQEFQKALSADAVTIHEDGTLNVKVPNAQKVGRVLVMDTDSHIGGGLFYPESAEAVQGYTEWLEKIIVDNEGANEWLCEDTSDLKWCEKNCHYSSIQAECLRHLYEVSKGGAE